MGWLFDAQQRMYSTLDTSDARSPSRTNHVQDCTWQRLTLLFVDSDLAHNGNRIAIGILLVNYFSAACEKRGQGADVRVLASDEYAGTAVVRTSTTTWG
jgi:hypothetical protein